MYDPCLSSVIIHSPAERNIYSFCIILKCVEMAFIITGTCQDICSVCRFPGAYERLI